MTSVVLIAAEADAAMMATDLELEGVEVRRIEATELQAATLVDVDALLVTPSRAVLTPDLVSACDRAGVRILPLGEPDSRIISRYGLGAPLPYDTPAWRVVQLIAAAPVAPDPAPRRPARVLAVWGPHGAPGRSTVAIQLAVELSRAGRHTALVDADSTAPSIALQLGLGDDAPGLAAACRRAELGTLDTAELSRLSTPVETSGGTLEVLGGLNRPSRWPELGAARVRSTLAACREWLDETVVDVSAEFEEDDDPLDPGGPARHAATASALLESDAVIAVLSADPLGVSRFVRGYAELRHLLGDTPITVVANRVRPGPLGIDARGQIRRTLDRFAGIEDVSFIPDDQRSAGAAALHARAIADVSPRSPLVSAVRRVASSLRPRDEVTAGSSPGSSRAARRLR